jgi:protein SCO1/2
MKPISPITKILVIASILLIPSVSYMVISSGENDYERLDIFGPKEPGTKPGDTTFHQVIPFILTDHQGNTFSNNNLKEKIFVAEFFFATCKTICPKMTMQMKRVQEAYKDAADLNLVSFTVDPAKDTVEALAAYAQKHGAVNGKWFFLTGPKKEIYDVARKGFFVSAQEGDGGPHDFIHTSNLVLVDKQMRIRGYYDGTDYTEVNRLIDEIKVLQWEYAKKEGKKAVW